MEPQQQQLSFQTIMFAIQLNYAINDKILIRKTNAEICVLKRAPSSRVFPEINVSLMNILAWKRRAWRINVFSWNYAVL